jgi:glyoxylase-like metal-dependent hydrolase (beta-lactamase superfamily II)
MIQRSVQLLSFGHSSGPGDIGVYEPRSGTFFAGGLADVQRIPDLTDADLPGWRDALSTLWALPIEEVLPGHGKPGTKRLIGQTDTYLAKLAERVQTLRQAGTPASEIAQAATLPEFQAWDGYLTRHPRNAALMCERGSKPTATER